MATVTLLTLDGIKVSMYRRRVDQVHNTVGHVVVLFIYVGGRSANINAGKHNTSEQ